MLLHVSEFVIMRIAILTISDRSARGERPDFSGPVLEAAIEARGWLVTFKEIVPDEFSHIRDKLLGYCVSDNVDVILTTGGTGFAARDVTPEATRSVIEREAPGLAEAMRIAGAKITPHAMLSRAVTGICRQVLIVNLPGSPKAAVENLKVIADALPHAVQLLRDDPAAEACHC